MALEHGFDSNEELYFDWYLKELLAHGIIKKYKYHPKPFVLSEPRRTEEYVFMKTKAKVVMKHLIAKHIYTADFAILWNPENLYAYFNLMNIPSYPDIFFLANEINGMMVSYIDVKGQFAGPRNTSAVTFPSNQKWVLLKHGIYVQKVIPKELFRITFTPERYLLTDKNMQTRLIKWNLKNLAIYDETQRNNMERLSKKMLSYDS